MVTSIMRDMDADMVVAIINMYKNVVSTDPRGVKGFAPDIVCKAFFSVQKKGKGYMLTDTTVNKIRLLKNGKARPAGARAGTR